MKHLHENLYVAGQISAQDFEQLAKAGIKIIINNRPDNEEPNQLSAEQASELAKSHDIEYHFLPMSNNQPLTQETVDSFKNIVDSSSDSILAHCRSGMRSTFIWALGQLVSDNITVDQAIEAATQAGIPLANQRAILESVGQ